MPGHSAENRRIQHSLYRRGQLSAAQRRNVLKKLERRGKQAAGPEEG